MKRAFCDTCIFIAFLFLINSNHNRSINVFNMYDKIFWSEYVKIEFDNRFGEKYISLFKFFTDLKLEVNINGKEFYKIEDLKNFIRNNYADKIERDAYGSVDTFWNRYVGIESQIRFIEMKNAINECLSDLDVFTSSNKKTLESLIHLTSERTRSYNKLNTLLESAGVSEKDRPIALDAHDFTLRSPFIVDFVTFDEKFFRGAKNTSEFACDVKGKYDF